MLIEMLGKIVTGIMGSMLGGKKRNSWRIGGRNFGRDAWRNAWRQRKVEAISSSRIATDSIAECDQLER